MWQYQNTDELYHYGILGMRWGIRRNARVLANHRRNVNVRRIKDQYDTGKINKKERNFRIKQENIKKKKYISDTNNTAKSIKNRKEFNDFKINIAKQTINEVPHQRLKKGLTTVNKVIAGIQIGSAIGVGLANAAIVPGLAGLALNSAAAQIACVVGSRALIQLGIDKLS